MSNILIEVFSVKVFVVIIKELYSTSGSVILGKLLHYGTVHTARSSGILTQA